MADFNEISWRNVGISIDILNEEETMKNPETIDVPSGVIKHTPVKKSRPADLGHMSNVKRVLWVSFLLVVIGIIMVSFMAKTAEAGQAFMRFKIHTVTEETIIVMDEHEDFFTFYKEGSPDVKVGDEVIVCTDLTFTDGKWEWNRSRTAIIDVVR